MINNSDLGNIQEDRETFRTITQKPSFWGNIINKISNYQVSDHIRWEGKKAAKIGSAGLVVIVIAIALLKANISGPGIAIYIGGVFITGTAIGGYVNHHYRVHADHDALNAQMIAQENHEVQQEEQTQKVADRQKLKIFRQYATESRKATIKYELPKTYNDEAEKHYYAQLQKELIALKKRNKNGSHSVQIAEVEDRLTTSLERQTDPENQASTVTYTKVPPDSASDYYEGRF